MEGFIFFVGAIVGFLLFAVMVIVTGIGSPSHYYQQNVCVYQGGTWHGADDICTKGDVVLNIQEKK